MTILRPHTIQQTEPNLAKVYDHLLRKVYKRDWAVHTGATAGHPVTNTFPTYEKFRDFLAVLGVAAMQSGGRGASLKDVQALCDRMHKTKELQEYQAKSSGNLADLFLSFYFRYKHRLPGTDSTFEFTHKSFGEYLYAIHVVNTAAQLARKFDKPIDPDEEGSARHTGYTLLAKWLPLVGPAELTPEINRFLFGEMRLRAGTTASPIPGMRVALKAMLQADFEVRMPAEKLTGLTFRQMTKHVTRAEYALVQTFGACTLPPRPLSFSEGFDLKEYDRWLAEFNTWIEQNPLVEFSWPSVTSAAELLRQVRPALDEYPLHDPTACPLCLSRWNLENQWLLNCDLSVSILDGARLVGAILDGARLDRARLVGAILDGARLDRARLVGARLVGARLDGAILDGARLDGASLIGARLVGVSLGGASLIGARLDGARLDRAILDEAILDGAILDGAILDGARLERADFRHARLAEATYGDIKLDTPAGKDLLKLKGAIV